jgi:hypothetical protein
VQLNPVINRLACPRSFAIVIQQLPAQLRDAVCVFYLVLLPAFTRS